MSLRYISNNMTQLKQHHIDCFLIFIFASIMYWIFFPGLMSEDTLNMFKHVEGGICFAEPHPPIMMLLWWSLNFISSGSQLMLLINMILLWVTVGIGFFSIKNSKLRYLFLLMPFVPNIMVHIGFIWKDVTFSLGFALIMMFLSSKSMRGEILTFKQFLATLFGAWIFFGFKYQAQFVLIFPLFWAYSLYFTSRIKVWLLSPILCVLFIYTSNIFTASMLSESKVKSVYWQYVKIFDLIGISVFENKIVIPDVLKLPDTNISKIETKYFSTRKSKIDLNWELFVSPSKKLNTTPDIIAPRNDKERETLLIFWKKYVKRYFLSYIKHRVYVWVIGNLLRSDVKKGIDKIFPQSSNIFLNIISFLSRFVFVFPLMIISLIFGIYHRKRFKVAIPIIYFNFSALVYSLFLLYFSLSGTPRYVFFPTVFFFISFPFTIYLMNNIKRTHIKK